MLSSSCQSSPRAPKALRAFSQKCGEHAPPTPSRIFFRSLQHRGGLLIFWLWLLSSRNWAACPKTGPSEDACCQKPEVWDSSMRTQIQIKSEPVHPMPYHPTLPHYARTSSDQIRLWHLATNTKKAINESSFKDHYFNIFMFFFPSSVFCTYITKSRLWYMSWILSLVLCKISGITCIMPFG